MSPAVHLTDTHLEMVSFYNCSRAKAKDDSTVTDVMDNIKSFKPELWGLLFVYLLVFMVLIILHYRTHRDSRHGSLGHGFWTVTTFFLKNDAMHEVNHASKLISFILCVFMFMIWTCFFENLMSTDLVTSKQPFVARSYDDITNQAGHKPLWIKNVPMVQVFNSSADGTSPRRLFQKAQQIGIENCLIDMKAPADVYVYLLDLAKQFKTTMFLDKFGTKIVRTGSCIVLAHEGVCNFQSIDPDERFQVFLGLVGTKQFVASEVWLYHMKWLRRLVLEADFLTPVFDFVLEKTPSYFNVERVPWHAMECLSMTIVFHTPERDQLAREHLNTCFLVYFILLFFAAYILQSEIYHRQGSKNKVSPEENQEPQEPVSAIEIPDQIEEEMESDPVEETKDGSEASQLPGAIGQSSSHESWKQIQKEYCKSYYATRKYGTTL